MKTSLISISGLFWAAILPLAFAVQGTAVCADEAVPASTSNDAEAAARIVITPGPRLTLYQPPPAAQQDTADDPAKADSAAVEPNDGMPVIVPKPIRWPSYREIYRTIPFSRSEYRANPSYRHEATMELLTGNPRPAKTYLVTPRQRPLFRGYYDRTRGPYSRYQGLFGYQGGFAPKYYRY